MASQIFDQALLASYGGTANLAGRLHQLAANWTASGDLQFLNEWTYKLGEEVLETNKFRSSQVC